MSLPTLNRVWEVDPNNAGGMGTTLLEDHRRTLFAIKTALVGDGSAEISTSPWTVARSSDGTTASAADNWDAITDLVWNTAGNAHSWIVLEQPGSKGYQLCIDLSHADARELSVVWSPAGGFSAAAGGTNGTTTARPTATDELVLINDAPWFGDENAAMTTKVHVLSSADGDGTIIVGWAGGVCRMLWVLDVMSGVVSGLTDGTFLHLSYGGTTTTQQADFATGAICGSTYNFAHDGATLLTPLFLSYEGYGAVEEFFGVAQTTPNDLDGASPIGPMALWSEHVGKAGRLGKVNDVFWGLAARADGDQYPDTGTTRQLVQVNDVIIPWDSSTVMQTA